MNNFLQWDKLLCSNERDSKSISLEPTKDLRSQYTRDVDRITFYADFRRLSHKTQVFSFPSNNIIHNRLTHSLEVASIAKNLAERIALYIYDNHNNATNKISMSKHDFRHALMQISQASSLIHDIGNPPFGHSGEDSIKEAFTCTINKYKDYIPSDLANTIQDLENFEGNAYGLHLLLTRKNLNLTYATIGTMIKYPICTKDWLVNDRIKKNGIFNFDLAKIDTILNEMGLKKEDKFCRHPLSYIMEAADDIAYAICDLEDAFRLGIINEKSELNGHLFSIKDILLQLINIEKFEKFTENFSYIRSKAISKLSDIARDKFVENYSSIMNGTFEEKDLLSSNSHLNYIKKFSAQSIYKTSAGLFLESASFNIIDTLLSKFLTAYMETQFKNSKLISYKNILKLLEQESDTFRLATTHHEKLFAIVGFIVRMSDNYAMDFYNRITGITTKGIE